ncbi:hypothetical protein DDB_G0294268 [Dictyostelium discoideum AX4]|uniref:Uncharacterized protein n=1 Tax=Dictyostelium discoideum TaxID=44689 RepID=Q54AR2_DICDI|nr:hypothetical protein DDB_G0294268 [Dictyostelium discoideum AX4]EAL60345.1 hypothetical protein DDB_G0294268 [Dictyostelium discoideum AX4]|eukprot:XP_628758.1 hypothetical protein DDB_G0294268 [Dictyostelium discoideum AX4]
MLVSIPDISYKQRQEIILKNIEKYKNNWSSKSTKKQFKIGDTVFLLETLNKKKTLFIIIKQRKEPMILPQYNDLDDSNDSNDSNDLTSFTSNLYLSNHRKVVEILLSFTKKIGYDLTNYNFNAIAIPDDPLKTLNPPDIVSQTPSNPPTIVTIAPSNPPTIVTQAPSYTPTIVIQAPSNPPAIVTQTPSNTQAIVTQTLSNHPDNVIVPMLSPIKIQHNKQIILRSLKHDSPQKPKKY